MKHDDCTHEHLIVDLNVNINPPTELMKAVTQIQEGITRMALQIDQLIQDVTDETTVIDGLSTLIDTLIASEADLAAQLKAAGTDPAKLTAVHTALLANSAKLGAKKQAIADAIAANTTPPVGTVPPTTGGPVVTSIQPTNGVVGANITIFGSGFGQTQGSSTLTCGGQTATINSWNDTAVSFSVPTGANQNGLVLTVNGVVMNNTFTVN